jgi:hypothetical protein
VVCVPQLQLQLSIPPKNGFQNNKQIQACLNSFYESNFGKVVEFGSVLSMIPGWSPNPGKNAAENVFLSGGKLVALKGIQKVTTNASVPSIVTGTFALIASPLEKLLSAAAGKILEGVETGGPLAVGAATLTDVMAHSTCATSAYPTPSVASPFCSGARMFDLIVQFFSSHQSLAALVYSWVSFEIGRMYLRMGKKTGARLWGALGIGVAVIYLFVAYFVGQWVGVLLLAASVAFQARAVWHWFNSRPETPQTQD